MAESAESLYARVVAQVGEGGRLPAPPTQEWESFPWEVVDGTLAPKVLKPPAPGPEKDREGVAVDDSRRCQRGNDRAIWANDRWRLVRMDEPSGLPMVVWLCPVEHLDLPELGADLAAEFGELTVRIVRAMEARPNIARAHLYRIGDGSAHMHVWFMARPSRLPQVIGSYVIDWDDILPPPPSEVWHADLAAVAADLARIDGEALITASE